MQRRPRFGAAGLGEPRSGSAAARATTACHPLTLHFADRELEHAFRAEHQRRTLGGLRLGLLLGAMLYAGFGLLDGTVIPDAVVTAWLIRFGLVCPVLLACLAVSYQPRVARHAHILGGVAGMVAGLGNVGLIVAGGSVGETVYYAGLLLVCMALYTFLQLRLLWALVLAWALVVAYDLVALAAGAPTTLLLSNDFFLVGANVVGMLACYSMERVLRRAFLDQRRIAELAQLDPLTELHNRRAFFSLAEQEVERCAGGGLPISAAMLDLDHFKHINDEHGHAIGDRVLQVLAETLRAGTRPGDLVCRYGGEEFLILLPGTGVAEARAVSQRLRTAVAELVVPTRTTPVHLSASLGVATVAAGQAGTLEALITSADAALYAAKRAGRNRVVAA